MRAQNREAKKEEGEEEVIKRVQLKSEKFAEEKPVRPKGEKLYERCANIVPSIDYRKKGTSAKVQERKSRVRRKRESTVRVDRSLLEWFLKKEEKKESVEKVLAFGSLGEGKVGQGGS